jgi:NADH pyrophosphatase NudC (nudix superfamily)
VTEARFCLRCGGPLVRRDDGGRARLACDADGCGFVFYDNPTPVVAAIVEREGHVILVRAKTFPEKWFGLVTGFLERGESPAEAIVREVKEELDLEVRDPDLVGVFGFAAMNQVIVAYHAAATGEVTLGDELAAYKAVPIEKLRPWPFGTGEAVAAWLARRARP